MNLAAWVRRLIAHRLPTAAPAHLDPGRVGIEHVRRGNDLLAQGRLADATEAYICAAAADDASSDAHINLAFVLLEQGRAEEALQAAQRAIVLAPDSPDGQYLLGRALAASHEPERAIAHLQRSLELKPGLLAARLELGKLLHDVGHDMEAAATLVAGLAFDAHCADLHLFLGNVRLQQVRLDEALASYRQALLLQPGNATIHSNMAPVLLSLGRFEEAADAARAALSIDASLHVARSNLLVALSCDAECPPEAYLSEAALYGAIVTAESARTDRSVKRPAAQTTRRLRVGLVSGDLRSHPVGYFLDGVLAHWRTERMDLLAYSNHASQDALTARLRKSVTGWRDISALSDDEAERLIHTDRIDVLIDLSGHTAYNRLPLFARRPAPVQVTWLGYWASTGVPAIDYLLADATSVPDEQRWQFSETVWPLPETRMCFSPPAPADTPDVGGLPALRSGHVTFGSFQRLTKLNDRVLRIWGRALRAVPNSRLRLQSAHMKDEASRSLLRERLVLAGIDPAAVTLVAPVGRAAYLAAHAEVDILLDTFPYTGATTTCEALWMGVPTLTMAGTTLLSRQGASLLRCVGLSDWIAADEASYVAAAVRQTNDLAGLARLRSGLRDRVAESPLADGRQFADALQQAIHAIWSHSASRPGPL